jgi:hypothetical protein
MCLRQISADQYRQQAGQAPHQPVDKRQQHFTMIAAAALTMHQNPSSQHETVFPSGTGSDVLRLTAPSKAPHRLTLRHSGEYNFIVWALDNRGHYRGLLVNKIGSYKGSSSSASEATL